MEKFAKFLEGKAKTQKPMSSPEKDAKMRAIHEMRKMASDEMSLPLKNLKKVTVASNSPEGVAEGLHKAQDMLEGAENETGEDLDQDMEAGENSEHMEKPEEEMSPEELKMKIMELQELLATKKMS